MYGIMETGFADTGAGIRIFASIISETFSLRNWEKQAAGWNLEG